MFNIFYEFSHTLLWIFGFIFCTLNAVFLYVLSSENSSYENNSQKDKTNKTNKPNRFMFDVQHKWLKPNSIFLPFEFNVALCNYFLFRISLFGYGFDTRIKWRDVVSSVNNTLNGESGGDAITVDTTETNDKNEVGAGNVGKKKKTPPKLKII